MIGYIAGIGTSLALAAYTLYCNLTFYTELKKTIITKQAETNDKSKTLEEIFTKDGVYTHSGRYPKSGIQPNGDIGTFFLKPTIHIAKVKLMNGSYDVLAEKYAARKNKI